MATVNTKLDINVRVNFTIWGGATPGSLTTDADLNQSWSLW